MDDTQVLIRPVVSEKRYVLASAGKYTFRVDGQGAQDADQAGGRGTVRRHGGRGAHGVGAEQAQAPGLHLGSHPAWKKAIVQVREGETIPIFQGLEGGQSSCRFASPSRPRPDVASSRIPTSPRSPGQTPGEVAHRGPEEVRRAQLVRPQDLPPPRRRRQAAVPQDRLQARARTACRRRWRDRVRPQPVRLHRLAALRRRREGGTSSRR